MPSASTPVTLVFGLTLVRELVLYRRHLLARTCRTPELDHQGSVTPVLARERRGSPRFLNRPLAPAPGTNTPPPAPATSALCRCQDHGRLGFPHPRHERTR